MASGLKGLTLTPANAAECPGTAELCPEMGYCHFIVIIYSSNTHFASKQAWKEK